MLNCEETEKGRLVVREEKRKKITFLNESKQRVIIVRVDGCKITKGNKCDFLFIYKQSEIEFFVELKGSDVKHACKQLEATIPQLTKNITKLKFSFVVCSKVAPSINPTIQNLILKFKRQFNSILIIKNLHCCFDIENLKEIDCSRI